MQLSEIKSLQELSSIMPLWHDLIQNASDPNIFYAPEMLYPAFEHYKSRARARILAVWNDDSLSKLLGLFPVERASKYYQLPIPHLRMWQYPHCYLCTPIIRRGLEAEVLQFLFNSFRPGLRDGFFFDLSLIPDASNFNSSLQEFLADQPGKCSVIESYCRAVHIFSEQDRSGDSEQITWLSKKQQKEFRRKLKKLEALGQFEFEVLQDYSELKGWCDDFLALEASGWKGSSGTALQCSTADRAFFHDIMQRSAAGGKLMMLRVRLEGQVIAMRCSFVSSDSVYSFKTAFNQEYTICSPGYLLEIENMKLVARNGLRHLDSCSTPGCEMFSRIYNSEQKFDRYRLSYPSTVSRATAKLTGMLQQLWRMRPRHAATT